jgi:hypothetical protein
MGNRLVLALVAAVAIVAVGGIGFATFTTSAYIGGSGTAGTVVLEWSGATATFCSGGYNTYSTGYGSFVNPDDTLYLAAGALAPGDYCTFMAYLNNAGSLPLTVTGGGVSALSGSGCPVIYYGDNINGGGGAGSPFGTYASSSPGISPSGSFTFYASIGLGASAGDAYQGTGCTFTVTFTGST